MAYLYGWYRNKFRSSCEVEHWREEFTGDWQAQTFLHYVNKNGKNKEWFKDKRPLYGMSK